MCRGFFRKGQERVCAPLFSVYYEAQATFGNDFKLCVCVACTRMVFALRFCFSHFGTRKLFSK